MFSGVVCERPGKPQSSQALWPVSEAGFPAHLNRAFLHRTVRSQNRLVFVAEISRIEIQICGRGAAGGVFYPLCVVSGLQLSSRPLLEPPGHPALHDGFRLRAATVSHPPPSLQLSSPSSYFLPGGTEVDRVPSVPSSREDHTGVLPLHTWMWRIGAGWQEITQLRL